MGRLTVLILVPPSETKRSGGEPGSRLDYALLRFPELTGRRRTCVAAVRRLARDPETSIAALRLGPRQHGEVEVNRCVTTSPVLPAIDRYTGVLYDALGAGSLAEEARAFLGRHCLIHSAILGPVGALDPIPAYRLSHDSRIPDLGLKAHWARAVARFLAVGDEFVLDVRSEAYTALGPAPATRSAFVRVVTETGEGAVRVLNHFNKHAKGEFVRALAERGANPDGVEGLVAWGRGQGVRLRRSKERPDEVLLVV